MSFPCLGQAGAGAADRDRAASGAARPDEVRARRLGGPVSAQGRCAHGRRHMAARRFARRSKKKCSMTRRVEIRVVGGDNMVLKRLVLANFASMFETALDVRAFYT